MESKKTKVAVKFTQQQIELLEKLKKEGRFGNNYPDIIVNLFHESIRDAFGKGGILCAASNE